MHILDFISKSACAHHHFPVILIQDPMEAFGRYLATQSILFTLVQGVSCWGVVLLIFTLRKKTSLYLSTVQCLTKTQGSRFQPLVQRGGVIAIQRYFSENQIRSLERVKLRISH